MRNTHLHIYVSFFISQIILASVFSHEESCQFLFFSDRLVPGLDTVVPSESTKAYDMLDIVHGVCTALVNK